MLRCSPRTRASEVQQREHLSIASRLGYQDDTGRNAYVGDQKRGAILVLDLEANTSLIFSGCVDAANPTFPGSRVGTGIELALPNALALDAERGRCWSRTARAACAQSTLETRVREMAGNEQNWAAST